MPGRPRVVPPLTPPVANSGEVSEIQAARLSGDEVLQIALDQIDENPYQTRKYFDEKALVELADSIKNDGLIQPIVVRPGKPGRYVLVLGERRCRASALAGKKTIPAIVRTVSEERAAEMTVVENLQRQDLNCLEQANAFQRLSREFGLTQEQIGQRTGVSRESVANYMRILKLPQAVQDLIASGSLGFSEARVLLQLGDPSYLESIAKEAASKGLSVIALKQRIDEMNLPKEKRPVAVPERVDPNVKEAQSELERLLGVRVRINDRSGKGKIVIEYATLDDFDRVLDMLKGEG